MRVKKRSGELQDVSFDKILYRIKTLCHGLEKIDPADVAQKVCSRLYDGVSTSELDEFAARVCISIQTQNPEYGILGSRIIISNNHKNTPNTFYEAISILSKSGRLAKNVIDFVEEHKDILETSIVNDRDYTFDYFAYKTLEKSYLLRHEHKIIERIQYLFMRVSVGIHAPNLEEVLKSYDMMSNKYFTHATPTLFNAGTDRPQLLSCFLTMPEDSIIGIYKWISDIARISKEAGGIGGSPSCIRGKGAYIRGTGAFSRGTVPMFKVVCETTKYVNQGGRRKGSAAMYMEPHHPDIMGFLELRLNHGDEDERARELFTAMWLSDLFMERVEAGGEWSLFDPDESPGLEEAYGDAYKKLYKKYEKEGKAKKVLKAQDVWKAIVRSQIETGAPYICFKDAVNKKTNHANLGTIRGSNLCVSPDTKILTDKGYVNIQNVADQHVNVWNGDEFSKALVKKTGENQQLLKIIFSNGTELKCTEYHKFYISKNYHSKAPLEVEAKDLEKGAKLWKHELPVITKGDRMKYPYTHGFFCADGTYENIRDEDPRPCSFKSLNGTPYCKRHQDCVSKNGNTSGMCQAVSYEKKPRITLYGEKKDLVDSIDVRMKVTTDAKGRINCRLPLDISDKYFVPMNYDLHSKLRWLEGYCDGDGTIARNGINESVQITSINLSFLKKVHLMCQTLGINPKVTKNNGKRKQMLPDGNGGEKEYSCKETYRLLISSYDLYKLSTIGFSPKRLKYTVRKPQRNANQFVKVQSVEKSVISDTYCFNEPKKHRGIFNGVYTGQCAEIAEYHSPTEYACCCLASICLQRFVKQDEESKGKTYDFEKLSDVAGQLVRNLNNVIDRNQYPVPETEVSNMRHRPLGIGVQGLQDTFFEMRYPFDSSEAMELNRNIFEAIYYGAMKASVELAKVHGPYETFKGSPLSEGKFQFDLWGVTPSDRFDWDTLRKEVMEHGVRNSLLVACMPTASTAQIMGSTECIEPITSNMYVRRVLSGEFTVINQYMIKDLQEIGLWSSDVKDQIIAHSGSIQHIKGIPSDIKALYKTAWELKQKVLIDMSAARGPFVCQTQSLNLFMEDPNYQKVTSAHFYSWRKGQKTGVYYLRTRDSVRAQQFTIDPRVAERALKSRELNLKKEETSSIGNIPYQYSGDVCESCSG